MERTLYFGSEMKRTGYLIIAGFLRVLAALAGAWIFLLIAVAAPWSSSHMVWWWLGFVLDVSGTIFLLIGVVTVASSRRLFASATLYGACAVMVLGASTFTGSRSSMSLLGALVFFALTITVPAFVALLCVYDLRAINSGGTRPPLFL